MAVFANKFTIQTNDVGRIVFVDERAPIAEGLPMSSSTAAEVVMTLENLEVLGNLIAQMINKLKDRG